MASENLFQQYMGPPKSVMDYAAEMDKADMAKLALQNQAGQNALLNLTRQQQMDQARQAMAKQNALQQILSAPGMNDPIARENALINHPLLSAEGLAMRKARIDAGHVEAQTEQQRAAAEASRAAAVASRATAGKTEQETQEAAAKRAKQDVASYPTPELAEKAIGQAVASGKLPMNAGQLLIQSLPKGDMLAFRQWQIMVASGLGDPAKMAELLKPHLQTTNIGGQTVMQAVDPVTGQPRVTGTMQNTQSPDSRAQVGLGYSRLAFDKSQAGRPQYDAERGVIVNPNMATATPVKLSDGTPLGPKDKPMPEGATKTLVGVRNLRDAIDSYQEHLRTWSTVGMLSPDARAKMGTAYNNMMLQAKEAYNLGVLNGPDYQILQSVVRDPTNATSVMFSNKAMGEQAAELKRIATGIERQVLAAHGKAAPNTPAAPSKKAVEWGDLK